MKPQMDFFFFIGSVYAYLAVMRIEEEQLGQGCRELAAIQCSRHHDRAEQPAKEPAGQDGLYVAGLGKTGTAARGPVQRQAALSN